ncbi:CrcB protein [Friedmanniella endophytica]|uniref:Fluoride-specific ion channel FluC n=1 Tax=Microlunatus kandeliicorticis TaxID=1759536 RepID=A0A7W3IPJ5_9ACTN|nr:CrcB family protein [Microlunatus kandeliicorticis]MBA8792876.1 CrcB protein [Microlunatus kandeliicorticis]
MTSRSDTDLLDGQLPPDPDIDADDPEPGARPVHLRWRYVGAVAVGGTVGTAARDGLSTAFPAEHEVSWAIFWINIAGALMLGVLLEHLAHRGPDEGRRRTLRLLLGTGVLGGFTTYSTLATSTAVLFLGGRGLAGTGYALLTVLAGAIATGLGLAIAGWVRPNGATS